MDRLISLGVLVAAVEGGNLATAACRFGLSVAVAGRYMSAIEADLNVRLLHRTIRRLSLTDTGQIYYKRCKRIPEAFDEARREASDSQGVARDVPRIATPVTFGVMHLGEVMACYMEDHPNATVKAQLGDRYVDLIDAGVDMTIRIGRLGVPGLATRRPAPCRMVVCVSPAYFERHETPRRPEKLLNAQRLVFSGAMSTGDWTLRDHENRAHIIGGPCRMTANDTQMLLTAVVTGAGIAYGPTFVFGGYIRCDELVELLPAYRSAELVIHAVYPSARHIPLKVRRFVDYLVEMFGDDPPWDRRGMSQRQLCESWKRILRWARVPRMERRHDDREGSCFN